MERVTQTELFEPKKIPVILIPRNKEALESVVQYLEAVRKKGIRETEGLD